MILFKTATTLQKHLQNLRKKNLTIAFAPTMGALHNGHLSLIEASKQQYNITVCSIFVNPAQFNDKKDFEKYPVSIEKDIYMLATAKCDILFLPSTNEIYPGDLQHLQQFDIGYLEGILEGKYRPGHFQGVCNVVYRLLNIIQPDTLFLGQKDYQQYLILKKMMQEFYPAINIMLADIKREENGLAMSSRNMRLSNKGRTKAAVIYQSLQYIKQNIFSKPVDVLKLEAIQKIIQNGFDKVDYVEICNAGTLLPVTDVSKEKMIVLAAAFIENVRLIDNLLL
jgi:pantoate--beta-alanine ligase